MAHPKLLAVHVQAHFAYSSGFFRNSAQNLQLNHNRAVVGVSPAVAMVLVRAKCHVRWR